MSDVVDLHRLLEFDKILTLLKQFTVSVQASEQFDELPFLRDKRLVQAALQQVFEFRAVLDHDDPVPLGEIWDLRRDLEVAQVVGGFLTADALIRVSRNLTTSRQMWAYLNTRKEFYPKLWGLTENITPLKHVEAEVEKTIDFKTAEVKDSATPQLAKIRRQISQYEENARRAMDKLFKVYSDRGYLQEELVSIKEGRLVLPVKWQSKGRVQGLVHDHSASGATLFVEPFEVVEINNQIASLRRDEAKEVERVLTQLTSLIREDIEIISNNLETLVELDFIRAKAYFAQKLDCQVPHLADENYLEISAGKHPLLLLREARENVVPLDLKLTTDLQTLVITGPNAGGKTVALKTVGLFALMLQSGLPIPANPDSRLPIFQDIFVDIGDFQSIENDLSSFTSHLTEVKRILNAANEKSLVLVDEIGIGTDPAEGSALAMAFLEELTKRSCTTIVTTHHGALKEFAYNTAGVENGSMEFDAETLRPTYRFRLGIPGSSYALEIAERLGLSQNVLARARETIGSEKGSLERLILDLEQKVQHSEKLAGELELENTRLKGLANLYSRRSEELKKNEKKLKKEALAEAQQIIYNANAAVEQAIKNVREGQANRTAITEAKARISTEKAKISRALDKEEQTNESTGKQPAKIALGLQVYWEKQSATGTIVSAIDASNKVMIQVDNLKFRVPATELFEHQGERTAAASSVKIKTSSKNELLPEIDLRGNSVEEAIAHVDKFFDDAMLAGWSQVRLIHGKGTGALRKGLDEFLAGHPRVRQKRIGAWNEGDIGVTVVDLR